MPENVFVGRIAETYDVDSPDMYEPAVLERTVSFLADAACGGAALEFGIGTGRVALPLHRRGVDVHGIDISTDMVAQLRAKPGSEGIAVTIGDFAITKVTGAFSLVYLVYNVISNLTTQDEQVECFRNAADHDLMARIAGMRRRERWADWDRSPFTSENPKHISVWERPA